MLEGWPVESWEWPERTFLILDFLKSVNFAGKRVLDLGSHYAMFSYAALHSGASYVYGIERETRTYHQPRASGELLEQKGYTQDQFKFVDADYFEHPFPQSDIVLALGVFYHTKQHHFLARKINRCGPQIVVIESMVFPRSERKVYEWETEHGETLYVPTVGFYKKLFEEVGWVVKKDGPSVDGRMLYLLELRQ